MFSYFIVYLHKQFYIVDKLYNAYFQSKLENKVLDLRNDKTWASSSSRIMVASKEVVCELISSDKVVIFSKTTCPYCTMAKECFNKLKQKYTAIELDNRDDGDDIQTILGEITGARTVPRVFVKGECLGGGTDVKKMFDSGELTKKLE